MAGTLLTTNGVESATTYGVFQYSSPEHGVANVTLSDVSPTDVKANYWKLLLVFFPLSAALGNLLVIFAVCREKTLRSGTNYFIVSLAVADLIVAVAVMPIGVYAEVAKDFGLSTIGCDLFLALNCISVSASTWNLGAISVDRYIAVTKPLFYLQHKKNKRLYLTVIFLLWTVATAMAVPIVLGMNESPARDSTICVFHNADIMLWGAFTFFCIVSSSMVVTYYQIFKILRLRARDPERQRIEQGLAVPDVKEKVAPQLKSPTGTNAETNTPLASVTKADRKGMKKSWTKQERKSTKTLAIVLGAFLVCTAPFAACNFTEAIFIKLQDNHDKGPWLIPTYIAAWLHYINSCLNPIIYTIFNSDFRNAFKRILRI